MGISRRHHYIPQFFIKHFAGEDGMLYLYDKGKKTFADNKRSPKSIFFELHRNTIDILGNKFDDFEKLYAKLDTKSSMDLIDMLNEGHINENNLGPMLIFVSSLKWRLPINDDEFDREHKRLSLEDLPINIHIENRDGTTNEEVLKYLENSETFKISKHLIFSFMKFNTSEEKMLTIIQKCYINDNPNIISILGDAPLIEDMKSSIHEFGNFILPIGTHKTFICSDSPAKKITDANFYVLKDLAVFHQSRKYVACSDKEHLTKIIDTYENWMKTGSSDVILDNLFRFT